jgi:protein TonB
MTSIPVVPKKRYRKYLPMAVGSGLLLLVVVAVVLLIRNFLSDSDEPKKHRVQQISLIKPPDPPPPPPKPPEEKPPEPKEEIKQEEQKQPTPQPQNTNQPPPGIGGAGYGNGDTSFGGSGGWMGGGGRFGFYLGGVQQGIHDELNRNEKLRKSEYKVEVALWIGKNGIISRFELLGSSGDKELDALMKKALVGAKFDEPPSDIPQPIKLRISSR